MMDEAFKEYTRNINSRVLGNLEVYIDISGICNLRCRSCQVYNHAEDSFCYHGRGFMKPELFEQIIRKLKLDFPELKGVFLFTFGEPFLSPWLPEIIEILKREGLLCILSTNLSMDCDLEKILQKEPEYLKVSVSGFFQEVYGTTHNGGDIRLVKSNLYRMRWLMDRHKLKTTVMVGYHMYTNNQSEDYKRMENLCKELGFLFQPRLAEYCNLLKKTGIGSFTEEEKAFIKTYYEDPERILNCSQAELPGTECRNQKDKLVIDFDGRVGLCCAVLHKDALYKNYLDTTPEEIVSWKKEHWICKRCKQYGLELPYGR